MPSSGGTLASHTLKWLPPTCTICFGDCEKSGARGVNCKVGMKISEPLCEMPVLPICQILLVCAITTARSTSPPQKVFVLIFFAYTSRGMPHAAKFAAKPQARGRGQTVAGAPHATSRLNNTLHGDQVGGAGGGGAGCTLEAHAITMRRTPRVGHTRSPQRVGEQHVSCQTVLVTGAPPSPPHLIGASSRPGPNRCSQARGAIQLYAYRFGKGP